MKLELEVKHDNLALVGIQATARVLVGNWTGTGTGASNAVKIGTEDKWKYELELEVKLVLDLVDSFELEQEPELNCDIKLNF